MKKLSKILLVSILGLAFLGTAVSCSNGSSDSSDDSGKSSSKQEQKETEKDNKTPQGGDNTKPVDTSIKTKDGVLSVTPTDDGFKLKITKKEGWTHLSFLILDYPDDDWKYEPMEMSIPIDKNDWKESKEIEKTYKLVTKDKKYKIWYQHHGKLKDDGSIGEWDGYYSADRDGAAVVKAKGGAGDLKISCSKGYYLSPRRGMYLKDLNIQKPSILNNIDIKQRWHLRIENGGRYKEGTKVGDLYDRPFTGDVIWFPKDFADNEYLKDTSKADKIYVEVSYKFDYENVEYKIKAYKNGADWDSKNNCSIEDSNWFVDYKEIENTANKLPKVFINSIENDDGNIDFVTKPVAAHVREQTLQWTDEFKNSPAPEYKKSKIFVDVSDDGTGKKEIGEGQVKVRGNYTTTYDKKSFRIKLNDKANLLGLNSGKKFKNWVLLACFKDASLLRDATALKMYKELFPDYYASDFKLVEVFVNDVYWGVYLLAEQQETKKNRINIREPETDTGDKYTGTDIGYLIEFDSYSVYEKDNEKFTIDYLGDIKDYNGKVLVNPQDGYTIKSDVNDKAQHDFIADYMNKLWKICYNASYIKKYYKFGSDYKLVEYTPEGTTDDEKCKNCISEVIDIKSLADMYIFNELVCDPDLYLTSFLMDIDFAEPAEGEDVGRKDKKLRFEAPWDFDSTMGNKRHAANAQGMFAGAVQKEVNFNDDGYANPWMVIFIKQAWFQTLVKSEWAACKHATVASDADEFISSFAKYAVQLEFNRTRWDNPSSNGELNPDSAQAAATSHGASADYLKDWLAKRFTAVNTVIGSLTAN